MHHVLLIACGGAVGALLRYGLGTLVQRIAGGGAASPAPLPIGTLTVNLLGCLLIGVVGGVFATSTSPRDTLRFFVIIGVLGAFTTFSTFAWETLELLRTQGPARALAYVAASNVLGVVGVWLGYALATRP